MSEILNKQEVDAFIEKYIVALIKCINPKDDDCIYVNRKLTDEKKFIFIHPIYVCSPKQIGFMDEYDNSELFFNTGPNLYFYLKGRLLIQTETTWEIWTGVPFTKDYEISCDYTIKED